MELLAAMAVTEVMAVLVGQEKMLVLFLLREVRAALVVLLVMAETEVTELVVVHR